MRPTIGITTTIDDGGRVSLRPEYVRAVEKAGGVPVLLAPAEAATVPELLTRVSGVMLTSGDDVDPSLFGETPHPTTRFDRFCDDFEIAVTREALRRDLPLLAICRGQQILNVAQGGTLVQDIASQIPRAHPHRLEDVPRWHLAHDVVVAPGTRLREILGHERLAVNSFHHQAVRDVGRGLVVSAHGDDGVIEGVESPGHRFAIGVQWHPEAMWNREPDHQEVFRALVEAARQ